MKDESLKRTGIFIAIIGAAAFVFNAVYYLLQLEPSGTSLPPLPQLASFVVIIILGLLSAYVPILTWIQPALFLAGAALAIGTQPDSFYGVGMYVIGIFLLFRMGFFERRRVLKIIIAFAYLFVVDASAFVLHPGMSPSTVLGAIFFTVFFITISWFAFQGRIAVYLKEPKPRISLLEKGLSVSERSYTLALIEGRSIKEIASDFEVADSTVRNTLARAYKKLGVEEKAGVVALAMSHQVVS